MRVLKIHTGLIVSDLHIGGGGKADDFEKQATLFLRLLSYATRNEIPLIVNGDLFELAQFDPGEIRFRWKTIFRPFEDLVSKGLFYYITGNHDLCPSILSDLVPWVCDAARIETGMMTIHVEHGNRYDSYNRKPGVWHTLGLRLLRKLESWWPDIDVKPNYSASRKKDDNHYRTVAQEILAHQGVDVVVFGHTHRGKDKTVSIPSGDDRLTPELKRYVNTGCWTKPEACQVAYFDGDSISLLRVTGKGGLDDRTR